MTAIANRPDVDVHLDLGAPSRRRISAEQILLPTTDEWAVALLTASLLFSKFAGASSGFLFLGFVLATVRRPQAFVGPW